MRWKFTIFYPMSLSRYTTAFFKYIIFSPRKSVSRSVGCFAFYMNGKVQCSFFYILNFSWCEVINSINSMSETRITNGTWEIADGKWELENWIWDARHSVKLLFIVQRSKLATNDGQFSSNIYYTTLTKYKSIGFSRLLL